MIGLDSGDIRTLRCGRCLVAMCAGCGGGRRRGTPWSDNAFLVGLVRGSVVDVVIFKLSGNVVGFVNNLYLSQMSYGTRVLCGREDATVPSM